MSDESSASGGIGFMGVLCIVFVVMKLCGTISWSWWWVTAPLWGPVALVLIILIVIVLAGGFSR